MLNVNVEMTKLLRSLSGPDRRPEKARYLPKKPQGHRIRKSRCIVCRMGDFGGEIQSLELLRAQGDVRSRMCEERLVCRVVGLDVLNYGRRSGCRSCRHIYTTKRIALPEEVC